MSTPALEGRLQEEMKAAMKARRPDEVGAYRMLLAALKNKRIELMRDLTDDDVLAVLGSEAKRRKESVEAFRKGGREELAAKEEAELHLIERYLPQPLSDEELAAVVDAVIAESGASSAKEMGKVMGAVMPRVKGRADGTRVRQMVQARLDG